MSVKKLVVTQTISSYSNGINVHMFLISKNLTDNNIQSDQIISALLLRVLGIN